MINFRRALNRSFGGSVLLIAILFFAGFALGDTTLSGTKVDSFVDSDSDGKAEVGETIEYTITIENTGGEDAQAVKLEDILDPNTDLVPGSVIVARDDIYETVGNTRLEADAAGGVLANDADPDGTGDFIFVFEGSGSYDGGLLLEDAQKLIGQGVDLVVDGKTLQTATSAPTITNTGPGASVITLAGSNEIRGVVIDGGNGHGIAGDTIADGVTIADTEITGNSGDGIRLANLSGVTIDLDDLTIFSNTGNGIALVEVSGTLTLNNSTVSANGGAGLYLDNSIGNGTLDMDITATVFDENSGPEFQVRGGASDLDYTGDLNNDSGYLVDVSNTTGGTLTFTFGTITGTGGSGIRIVNSAGNVNVDQAILTGSSGIDIGAGAAAAAGFIVEDNTLDTLVRAATFAGTVGFGSTSSRKMTGKIRNNDLDDTNGSAYASIISGLANPSFDITVDDNNADDAGRYGLRVRLDDKASAALRATGNSLGVTSPVGNDSNTRDGIEIRSRDDTGDYYALLKNNQVVTNGSIGNAIDIDAEDNAAIYLAVTEGNLFRNDGGGRDFDAETEDPGSEICLKLTGHTSRTFDLTETAGNFTVESLTTLFSDNPGATINIGAGVESSPGCPVHPAEPADP